MAMVSKAHPTIKKIISKTVGTWGGRNVSVEQVDPSRWRFSLYNDTGEPKAYLAKADGSWGRSITQPAYGAGPVDIDFRSYAHEPDDVVVVKQIGHNGSITIYIPRLDQTQLDVARDALMSGRAISSRAMTDDLGPYGGIAHAIVESQTKTLEKATSGKTSRQLDREIAEFIARGRR